MQSHSDNMLLHIRPRRRVVDKGWGAVVFGTVGMATGLFVLGLAVGFGPREDVEDIAGKPWPAASAVGFMGMAFFWFGWNEFGGGLRDIRLRRRTANLANARAWLGEHDWDPHGAVNEITQQPSIIDLIAFAVCSLCLVRPHLWVITSGAAAWKGWVALAFADLCMFALLLDKPRRLLIWIKYGKLYLHFHGFPYYLGETAHCQLSLPRRMWEIPSLQLMLRCVQETVTGIGKSRVVHCDEVYRNTYSVSVPKRDGAQMETLKLSLPIPGGDYATDFKPEASRYWHLCVTADVAGIDPCAVFLLPVYERPVDPRNPQACTNGTG